MLTWLSPEKVDELDGSWEGIDGEDKIRNSNKQKQNLSVAIFSFVWF